MRDSTVKDAVAVRTIITAMINDSEIRQGTIYASANKTIKVTHIHNRSVSRKPRVDSNMDLRVTIGRPNYPERKFIKMCKRAGEPFPVKKIQFKFFPAKKRK